MKNWFIILTLLFIAHSFNDLQAQARIDLLDTTGGDGINEGDIISKLNIHYFKALSKDDCERAITLTGTIEVVDILEDGSNPPPNQLGIKTRGKQYKRSASNGASHSASSTLSSGKNQDEAYTIYQIPPTTGSTINFDNSEQEKLTKFGNRFYVIFTFEDLDNCERNGSDPIDLNPDVPTYETLQLYVNLTAKEVRLASNGELTGTVVGGINEYFSVAGNLNAPPNVEVGEIRMKISSKPKNMGPGNIKGNGG